MAAAKPIRASERAWRVGATGTRTINPPPRRSSTSREDADPALASLIEEVEDYLPDEPPSGVATQPVVSLDLRTPLGQVSLFTVIATLGAPLEVTAANLAIETFVPMDAESAARLAELSAPRSA
jgi:hypothetical protein